MRRVGRGRGRFRNSSRPGLQRIDPALAPLPARLVAELSRGPGAYGKRVLRRSVFRSIRRWQKRV